MSGRVLPSQLETSDIRPLASRADIRVNKPWPMGWTMAIFADRRASGPREGSRPAHCLLMVYSRVIYSDMNMRGPSKACARRGSVAAPSNDEKAGGVDKMHRAKTLVFA